MELKCLDKIKEIQQLLNETEFYFEKLRKIFKKFENYPISNEEIDYLLNQVIQVKGKFSFQNLLDDNKKYKEFLLLIGKIIAMSDFNGYNKREWNEYDDKRVVAKATIYQNDWVKNLLLYKKEKSLSKIASGVKNLIKFIKIPSKNLTQLSKKHRGLIAKYLLNKDYNPDTFFEDVKEYFEKNGILKSYKLKNQENLGVLLSFLLNCEEIKSVWKKNKRSSNLANKIGEIDKTIDYWLLGAIYNEKDKTEEFLQKGIWVNYYGDKHSDKVNKIKEGDLVAIKYIYKTKDNLPFDNKGQTIGVMKIKAIEKVEKNFQNGKK